MGSDCFSPWSVAASVGKPPPIISTCNEHIVGWHVRLALNSMCIF